MSRTPTEQAKVKAARVLRAGGSEAAAARAAGRGKRQIQRWKLEPAFEALMRHETVITVGNVPEPDRPVPSGGLLGDLPPSRAWLSVGDVVVVGSALHPLADGAVTNNCDRDSGRPGPFTAEVAASVVQVELVSRPERVAQVAAALAAGLVPDDDPDAVVVALTLAGLLHVQRNPDDLARLIRNPHQLPRLPRPVAVHRPGERPAPRPGRGAVGRPGGVRAHDRRARGA